MIDFREMLGYFYCMFSLSLEMAFNGGQNDLFDRFAEKYDLVPGFQGDYDLRAVFGDLVDDQSFTRDRVRYKYVVLNVHNCDLLLIHVFSFAL